jgi:hypothetical protein
MKFEIATAVKKELVVRLELRDDEGKDGSVYLYANDHPIMGFYDGMYTKYPADGLLGIRIDETTNCIEYARILC